jgi:CHAT domain-containing protein/Tfp pilus assembly protein PilF
MGCGMSALRSSRRERFFWGLPRLLAILLLLILLKTACHKTSSAASPPNSEPTSQLSPAVNYEDLVRQAGAVLQAGQTALAVEKYRVALKAAHQQRATSKAGAIELLLGIAYEKDRRWQEAADVLSAAIRDNDQLGYLPYSLLGISYQQLGRWKESLDAFQQAAKLKADDAGIQAGLGAGLVVLGKPEQALHPLEKAVRLNPGFAGNHFALGVAYSQTGQLEAAIKEFREAVRLQPDNFWAYVNAADAFGRSKRFQEEIIAAQQAIRLNPHVAEPYYLLGTAHCATGRIDDARKDYDKALAIKPSYSPALYGLGVVAESSGDLEGSQNHFNAAYRSLADISDWRNRTTIEAAVLIEEANIQRDLGNYAESFGLYTQAVQKYQLIADHKQAATALVKIAEMYRKVGDTMACAQWYTYALQESQKGADVDGQSTALVGLGLLAWSMGDRAASSRYGQEAQGLLEKVSKDPNSKALFLTLFLGESGARLGELLAASGDPQAIPFLQARIAAYSRGPQGEASLREVAVSSGLLADAYIRAGRYEQALDALKRAEAIAEEYKSPEILWVYLRIGEIHEKQGNLAEAMRYYEQAATMLERFGAAQRLPELHLSARELAWGNYENLTRVSLKLYAKDHKPDYLPRAFTFHETGKARAFLELLNEAGVRVRKGVDPKLVSEEDRLRARISALQNVFSDERFSDLKQAGLQDALVDEQAALKAVQDKVVAANFRYAAVVSPQVVAIGDIQRLLGNDAVLLEYDLGPELSALEVLTDREMRVFRLPSQDAISKALGEFLPTLRAPLLGTAEITSHVKLAKDLYLMLLGPARDLIRGKRHIVIVPDGDLYYLPFEALIATDQKADRPNASLASQSYLGKDYSFSYAPSASVLVTIERNARKDRAGIAANRRPLLAFGDPIVRPGPAASQVALSTRGAYEEMGVSFNRLPYSGDEVRRVAAVYGIKSDSDSINLGSQATRKRLEQLDLTQYRILHFATHAVVGDEVKWISQPALILSPEGAGKGDDGVLKMAEIFNLRLNADLVVLSACETARGEMSRGEGIVGLTSAFLFAGSDAVVASLWNVNDESTSLFMEHFYTALKEGLTKAEALRKARCELMQMRIKENATSEEESLASPYFWAPFILVGGWR